MKSKITQDEHQYFKTIKNTMVTSPSNNKAESISDEANILASRKHVSAMKSSTPQVIHTSNQPSLITIDPKMNQTIVHNIELVTYNGKNPKTKTKISKQEIPDYESVPTIDQNKNKPQKSFEKRRQSAQQTRPNSTMYKSPYTTK